MHPVTIEAALDELLAATLTDRDGNPVTVSLLAGMSDGEIEAAELELGSAYPPAVRQVLTRARGISGVLDQVDFAGAMDGQALDDLFPQTATIAHDGYGNFWAVDLLRENGGWGPIWFLSHDPPVALLLCDGLAGFLDELRRMHSPPHASLIDEVHEDRLFRVGSSHPGAIPVDEAAVSDDPELAGFAANLGPGWTIIDLREAVPGMGIAWGRYGPRTELRRHDDLQLFAYRAPDKRGLLERLRGR